jgi:hypothetical protein
VLLNTRGSASDLIAPGWQFGRRHDLFFTACNDNALRDFHTHERRAIATRENVRGAIVRDQARGIKIGTKTQRFATADSWNGNNHLLPLRWLGRGPYT